MNTHRSPLLTFATSGVLAAGLLLAAPAADAATHDASRAAVTPGHAAPAAVSAARLSAIRARQREMLAQPGPPHTLHRAAEKAGATVQRLTVTTTEDSGLADAAGTRCIDAATGACSLRAAVEAANNRQTPVRIVLGKATYTLTTGTQLMVTNPAGTSIVGVGASRTAIAGAGSRVIDATPTSSAPGPLLYLTDLKVTGGSASDSGGGIHLGSFVGVGSLVLDGVVVSGNTAGTSGGGIYTENRATVYANKTTVTGNTAPWGAGLFTNWSNVNLTDVDLTANRTTDGATGGGEGWDDEYGVGTMTGGSISGNTAVNGGAGLFDEFGNLTFTDVAIDDNSLVDEGASGGGIAATSDLLEFTGGTISRNSATGDAAARGGGLFVQGGAQIQLHGVTMAGNRVGPTSDEGRGGGAIYLYGNGDGNQLTIDRGSKITGSNSSALYAYARDGRADLQIDDSRLSRNSDSSANGDNGSGCGGAMCAYAASPSSVNLTLSGDTLADNTSAGTNGSGAVSVWAASSTARVHLVRSVFQDNTTGANGRGGALGVSGDNGSSPVSVRSESNTFVGNEAGTPDGTGKGGAIGIENNAAFSDRGSTFTENNARGPESWGGAVYTETLRSSRFTGTTFTKNTASPNGIGYGGAVFTDDSSGTAYTGVSVTRNRSGGFGGGLDSSDGGFDVSVTGSTLAGNVVGNHTTSGTGGAIHVADGVLTLVNSTVTGNSAVQSDDPDDPDDIAIGGGIYSAGSAFGLRYSTVTDNVATQGGGYYFRAPNGSVLGSVVSANHRPSGGEQDCWSFGIPIPHSLGGNVLGQAGCVTATQGTDTVTRQPRLGPLADNGGQTRTMALARTSPAIGRATFQCPSSDQRGRQRPTTHCDAGAFELPKIKKHHH